MPASGLNLAAPLNSPNFTGTPTLNGAPFTGGSGGIGIPGGANGSLQFNQSGILGGYIIGSGFTTTGGVFNLGPGVASGPAAGDLSGTWPNITLAPGAAARGVGNLGGALSGALPNPSLALGAAAFNLGPAAGDIAGMWPTLSLAVGSASRSVGNLGACLGGTLPNPTSLAASCVLSAMGTPAGDLGGATYATPLVTGLQGFPIAPTPPQPNSALTWNGSAYVPTIQSPGINQLTGAISAGPGTGAQSTSINPGVVTNQNLANAPSLTLKCNAGIGMAAPSDCPVTGGLAFTSGALQLATNLGTSQQVTVGSSCWTVQNGFVAAIVAGSCSTGVVLTADDGATPLTADDGATQLTAEGGTPITPCTAIKFAFNNTCNLIARAIN